MHQSYEEILHLLMHAAARQQGEKRLSFYGHIVAYDPANHAVKVQIPSLAVDESTPGIVTGWIPLGSHFVGNGWGAQFAPDADASGIQTTTPTGTPCEIEINEQDGACTISGLRFTDKHQVPFKSMLSGEWGIKVQVGTYIYGHQDGSTTRMFQKDAQGNTVSETVDNKGNLSFLLPGGAQVSATPTGYSISGPEAGGGASPAVVNINSDGSWDIRNSLCSVLGNKNGSVALQTEFGTIEILANGALNITLPAVEIVAAPGGPLIITALTGIALVAPPNTITANGNVLG